MKAALIATAALLAASPAWAQALPQDQPSPLPQTGIPQTGTPQTGIPQTGTPQTGIPQAGEPTAAEEFVRRTIQDNIGDVELSRLVRETSDIPHSVRQLADRIALDNMEFNGELERLAQANGVAVSDEMADRDRQALERLSALRGEDFTKAYLSHLVTELERDVERYQQAALTVEDPQIQRFAEATAPRIQQQLKTARAVNEAQTAATPPQ